MADGRLRALDRGRAGAAALALAADPINRQILLGMSGRTVDMDGGLYTLSSEGREALFVASAVEQWLHRAPGGPIDFESAEAERAVAALIDGWSAALVHALARGPMTRAELADAIDGLGARRLHDLLSAMQGAGLVEAAGGEGEGTPGGDGEALYSMTDWLRRGIAPLIAAARLEREQELEGAVPPDASDAEAALRMALALIEMPRELSGVCALRVRPDDPQAGPPTGVTARLDCGEVVSCESGFEQRADAWALGSLDDWMQIAIEFKSTAVRTGGDVWLTDTLVSAIHPALFGPA